MKMSKVFLRVIFFVAVFAQSSNVVKAQTGDQILDGIGETGMIARYLFNGDLKDWSRINLHAKVQGEAQFVTDTRFGKVLSLNGDNNAFVTLPGEVLTDLESLIISGWINLRSTNKGQRFFDFGKNAAKRFTAAPVGTNSQEGFQAL